MNRAKKRAHVQGEVATEPHAHAEKFKVFRAISLKSHDSECADLISKHYQLAPTTGKILAARGFEPGPKLDTYLSPALKTGIPPISTLKNLDTACDLIASTVRQGSAIAISCDFDVDGLTGGAQVFHYLRSIGARVQVFTPNRFSDGYGLNIRLVEEIAQQGFSLLITIDFGTTNKTELARARELGLKTIVVDHHYVGDHQPGADVFVNPQQIDCGFADGLLCASGLAWFVVAGLSKRLGTERAPDPKSYLELACIGTICDMVPLIGPNRVIAKRGLELLEKSDRPGLRALKEMAGVKNRVQCSHVSFGIGPRLNAAGRMENAQIVLELLSTSDSVRAGKIARDLNSHNSDRQEIEQQIKEQAVRMVRQGKSLAHGIVVWDESFHTGVIGIVAQRLVEEFYRPSAVLGADGDECFKGSMRSIKGVSAIELLGRLKQYLIKFGGHEGAAGFSLKRDQITDFAAAFAEISWELMGKQEPVAYIEADAEAKLGDVSVELVKEIQALAPFGVGNPQPTLLFKNLKVLSVSELKGAHLKIALSDGERMMSGLMWRTISHPALKVGAIVDVAARPDTNTYGGMTGLQLTLQAVQVGSASNRP